MRWGFLSLPLGGLLVLLLVATTLVFCYLIDRGRADALQQQNLRLHAERGADEVVHFVRQLRGDLLFLADTLRVHVNHQVPARNDTGTIGYSLPGWQQDRLRQIFLSFANAKPEYSQIRLIGIQDDGPELARVERTDEGPLYILPEMLEPVGESDNFHKASVLPYGTVYLPEIGLTVRTGELPRPTLIAATPVYDSAEGLLGVIAMKLDMGRVSEDAESIPGIGEWVYISDEHGNFLMYPEADRVSPLEIETPFRLTDAFPGHAEDVIRIPTNRGVLLTFPEAEGGMVAYGVSRAWDPTDANRRLIFLLAKPAEQEWHTFGRYYRNGLLLTAGLLVLASILLIIMLLSWRRSLNALENASGAVARGDYGVALHEVEGGELGSLVRAFRHMTVELERRESKLIDLNRELKRGVERRTEDLAHQHAVQNLILENVADGVVVSDSDGRFLLWNRKVEQIVGSGPDEVSPERWSTHFGVYFDEAEKPLPTEELPLFRAMQGESLDNIELYLRNPNKPQGRWVQVTARPLREQDGRITGGVAVLVDVTEHKRLQRRVESHRAEFAKVGRIALSAEVASTAAHQLSQPIAAISNYAGGALRLQKQGRLDEVELLDILESIEALANRAGEFLNTLRGLIHRRIQPATAVDVNEVVDSSLGFLRERIEQQGVRVECRHGQGLPKSIGDPIELGQVLIQLISNALEAMESAEIIERRLSIGTRHDRETGRILIEIGDTGNGVDPALVECLFEPWVTDKPGALGIGLSIAQTIIQAFGGQIRMERATADGSLFSVELPGAGEAKG